MTKRIVSLLALFFSPALFGDSTANPTASKSAHALSTTVKNHILFADLKEGFHFNLKAPNQFDGKPPRKPSKISAQHMEIPLPRERAPDARASLYVCDDAITFCEVHHIPLGSGPAEKEKPAAPAPSAKPGKPDAHGFFSGNLEHHLAQARATKKLLLVDFSARWCPGCIRVESEIFPAAEFKKIAHKFVKVKIDVDLFENFTHSKRYAVQAIPTLLVLTSEGEEINRITDYQPLAKVSAFLSDALADPIALSQSQKKSGDAKKLGLRLFGSGRYDEAIAALSTIPSPPPELRQARVQAAAQKNSREKSSATRTALVTALQTAVKEEPQSLRSLAWRSQLIELSTDDAKIREENLTAARVTARELLAHPEKLKASLALESVGEFTGLERFLVAVTCAEILEVAHAPDSEVRAAWQDAERIGKKIPDLLKKPGPALRYLIVLVEAQNFTEADSWSAKIIREQPDNKDLLRRRLRVLVALHKYPEAIRVGEESLKSAEGRMEFLVIENLAKAYAGAGQKPQAKALLTGALARPELKLEKLKDDQARLKKLQDSL